jgi:hypothetical protein
LRKSAKTIEALSVLDAIARGEAAELSGCDHWIEAFKTVLWVVQTDDGLVLTSEGHQAHYEMASKRNKPPMRRDTQEP